MHEFTVLAVDDNEDNLDLIDDALAGIGAKVTRARSGPDAISHLMSEPFDVVLLDIMMPDMNGFAVLEMVRFIPRLMHTTVMIVTAHADRFNIDRARELGAKSVLIKPVSPVQLIDEVRKCTSSCATVS